MVGPRAGRTLEDIISTHAHDKKVMNNALQAFNHDFYWASMAPGGRALEPTSKLAFAVRLTFGSLDKLLQQFKESAVAAFGSAWTWLVSNAAGELSIVNTENAGRPAANLKPLLVCDVWEHGYYIDYRNDRPRYVDAFVQLIDWSFATARFNEAVFCVTSSVFPTGSSLWNEYGLLIPHEAIRADMLLISQFVGKTTPTPEQRAAFAEWYARFFYPFVHAHHDHEEAIYVPWIKTRATMPDKVMADHVALLELMERVRSAGSAGSFDQLASDASMMCALMLPHLEEEESITAGILQAHFTQQEEAAIVGQIMAAIPPEVSANMMCSVVMAGLRWMTDATFAEFLANVPPPVVDLIAGPWAAAYKAENRGLVAKFLAE